MMSSVKSWLAPPVFDGDGDRARLAGLINAICVVSLLFVLLVIVGGMLGGRTPVSTQVMNLLLLVILVLSRNRLHRGQITLAGLGLAISGFAYITAVNISLGTIRTPSTATYLFWVLMMGAAFHVRGLVVSVVASSAAVLGLILAENAGMLPQPDYSVTVTQWVTFTVLFGLTAGLTYYSNQMTRESLVLARREVEQRRRAEMELRKLTRAVEQSPASIVITDLTGNIEYVNPRFSKVTGYRFDEVLGKNPRILNAGQTPTGTHRQLWQTLSAGREWQGEFVNRKKDGTFYPESAIISPITDQHGQVTHYLAVKEDISERKQAEEAIKAANRELSLRLVEIEGLQAELREQALHDPLTGLYNRRYLNEALARELVRCRRENAPLSIIIADIDHFKKINDGHGHQAGDEVLVLVAALLKNQARGSDIACRYGGEEFLLVMPGSTLEFAHKRAEEIRQKCVALAIEKGGTNLEVTLSFGIAGYPDHGQEADEVIIRADQALYQSKANGRNRVTVWRAPDELA
jgi:diguanylate cyclase (GGDEF)-like protein/PAS domain S-box-containing protein